MLDALRSKFLPRFIETARVRARKASVAVGEAGDGSAAIAASELHTLAGEASILGFADIAELARSGEVLAKQWVASPGDTRAQVECARAVRAVVQAVEKLAGPSAAAAPAAPANAPPAPAPAPVSLPRRVLVVDDSPINAELLADALQAAGYETRTAGEHPAIEAELASFAPGVLLTDVHIPGVDTAALVAKARQSGVAVVLMSGMAAADLASLAQRLGAASSVSKELGTPAVVEAVAAIVAGRAAAGASR